MSHEISKTWVTQQGHTAAILLVNHGERSHHCGYVGVEPETKLHGLYYFDRVAGLKKVFEKMKERNVEDFLEDVGALTALSMAFDAPEKDPQLSYVLSVRGGVTYAGGSADYPIKNLNNLWWFGYDCAHLDDNLYDQHLNFNVEQCEKLSQQIKKIEGAMSHGES